MKLKNTAIINLVHVIFCWILTFLIIFLLFQNGINAIFSLFVSNTISVFICLIISLFYKKIIEKDCEDVLVTVSDVKFNGSGPITFYELSNKEQLFSNFSKFIKKGETKKLLFNNKKNKYYDPDRLTLFKIRDYVIALIIFVILTILAILLNPSIVIEEFEIFISFRFINLILLIICFGASKIVPYYFMRKELIEVPATTKTKVIERNEGPVKILSSDFEFEYEGEKIVYSPLNPPTGKNFDEVVRTLYLKKDGTILVDKAEINFLTIFTIIWVCFYLMGISTILFYIF